MDVIANVSPAMDYSRGMKTQCANAERIVACWNAFEGIEHPQSHLSMMAYERDRAKQERDKAEAERDQLRAALKELEELSEKNGQSNDFSAYIRGILGTLAILLTLAGSAAAQNARIIFQHSNCDVADMTYSLVNQQTGDTIVSGGSYFCSVNENIAFQLDPGTYSLLLSNPVVTGQGTGMFMLQLCGEVRYTQLYPFPTNSGILFAVQDPVTCGCPPAPEDTCPADINGDGLVGVADLLIFVSHFGAACP